MDIYKIFLFDQPQNNMSKKKKKPIQSQSLPQPKVHRKNYPPPQPHPKVRNTAYFVTFDKGLQKLLIYAHVPSTDGAQVFANDSLNTCSILGKTTYSPLLPLAITCIY